MSKKRLVLVIEDEVRQAEHIAKLVENTGYCQALVAHNGLDAFKILKAHQRGFNFLTNKIECILLDWQMPEMNGEEFIRILRKEENIKILKRHIPVIIISVYNDMERKKLAIDSLFGMASGYLNKPFKEHELHYYLNKILIDKDAETMREILAEQDRRWHTHQKELKDSPKKTPTLSELDQEIKQTEATLKQLKNQKQTLFED